VRLGNATQLWVDVDEWEVVALDVKPFVRNALLNGVAGGAVDHVLMSSLRQVGDVILVHDESAVERRWSSYGLSTVVGCDVVTERGTYIGRVRDFEFNPDDGMVQRIVVDALGLPIVPEGVVSTYAVDVTEILSTGMDRIILAEGAESRVEQLSASLLQRLQLTAPPWEDDLAAYADYYEADVRAAQQAEWERQQAWARQSQMDSQRMRRDDYYAPPPPQRSRRSGKDTIRIRVRWRGSRWYVPTSRSSGGTRTAGTASARLPSDKGNNNRWSNRAEAAPSGTGWFAKSAGARWRWSTSTRTGDTSRCGR
jgi:sporulation protein YlmC with PRC-barrel domain